MSHKSFKKIPEMLYTILNEKIMVNNYLENIAEDV